MRGAISGSWALGASRTRNSQAPHGGGRLDPAALARWLAEWAPAARYWVAFSGGLDSCVLLHALVEVRSRLGAELAAVHLDHGIQPHSRNWAVFCQRRCAALGVPLRLLRLAWRRLPGASLEAQARERRYGAFAELLAPGEVLLSAQHEDDQAETLLLALLRGSGVRGLAAMPAVAPLGRGRLARPLLGLSRAALRDYALAQGLHWIEDPSNADMGLDRNFLRHQVLPLLRKRWPAASTTLARSAAHCAEASELLDQSAAQVIAAVRGSRPNALSLAALEELDRPLRKSVVRYWLLKRGCRPPDSRRLDQLLDEVPAARPDANPRLVWEGCEVRRYRGELLAMRPLPSLPSRNLSLSWRITGRRGVLELPPGFGRLEWRCESDADSAGGRLMPEQAATRAPPSRAALGIIELQVRFGQSGHLCRTQLNRPRQGLKKLFQEAGIPAWLRPYLPLILYQEQLIAIAGVTFCHDRDCVLGARPRLLWSGFAWEDDWPQLSRPLLGAG